VDGAKSMKASGRESLANELVAVGGAILAFAIVDNVIGDIRAAGEWANIAMVAGFALLCFVARGLTAREVSGSVNIIVRVIALVLGAYGLASGVTYPNGVSQQTDTLLLALQVVAVAGALGALAVFRYPVFILVPCTAVLAQKAIAADLFEVAISRTDYIPLVEMGLFLGVGLCLMGPLRRHLPFRVGRMVASADPVATTTLLFLVAVGVHFANYFFSGLLKVTLDGGPLLWVLKNPTEQLGLNAWAGGFLPSAIWTGPTLVLMDISGYLRPAINVSILLAQLGSIIFVLRRRSMILATLFYDLTHVMIFLVSGIFFWKWIILNFGLVAAMRKLPRWVETPKPMLLGIAAILLAPNLFQIARLGWYDTPALTRSDVYAVTKDGRELQVPSNYFGTISVTAAQHRLGRVAPGHYPTVTWGTTQSENVFLAAQNGCSFGSDTRWQFETEPGRISRIVQLTHSYATQQAADGRQYLYDLFPHHIWSNPWMFDEFAALVPDDIAHYIYRTVSGCVRLGPDGPVVDEWFRDEFVIPVSAAPQRRDLEGASN